jgi:hypothetical protein
LRADKLSAEAEKKKGMGMMKTKSTNKTSLGWMKSFLVAGVVALCLAGASAQGAVRNALADAEWHVDGDWQGGSVPASDDTAVVNYGRTLTHSTGTNAINNLQIQSIASGNDGGNFNMTGGELNVNFTFAMGWTGTGGTATATQSGGTIDALNVHIGHDDADVDGVFNISGGTLNWSQAIRVGTLGSGTLKVEGTGATISGHNIFLNEHSTLQFNLGASSVSALEGNNLTIDSAADLIIDGSNFTGENGAVIDLITFGGTKTGTFDTSNITFQNFGSGLAGEIGYDADSMYMTVIPEPATLGLVMTAGIGLIALRRMRRE